MEILESKGPRVLWGILDEMESRATQVTMDPPGQWDLEDSLDPLVKMEPQEQMDNLVSQTPISRSEINHQEII